MISFGIGLAALVVLGLLVIRGVQRRTALLLTVADILVAIGSQGESLAGRLWRRHVRDLSYAQRWTTNSTVAIRVIDAINEVLFRVAWKAEEIALGQEYHYGGEYSYGYGLSAASEVRSSDRYDPLDYLDDNFEYDEYI